MELITKIAFIYVLAWAIGLGVAGIIWLLNIALRKLKSEE